MKYKNLNIYFENVSYCVPTAGLLSRLTSLFLSSISTRTSLKKYGCLGSINGDLLLLWIG